MKKLLFLINIYIKIYKNNNMNELKREDKIKRYYTLN